MEAQQQEIQVKASDEELKGRFSNIAQISHQEGQFIMDFFLVAPPAGQLVSRVVATPGHMKAIAKVINDQLAQYERNFGKVKLTEEDRQIGFKA